MKRRHEDVLDDVTHERICQAAEEVLKTKAITPLLKEELRLSILIRRHAQGAELIKAEFKDPEIHEVHTSLVSLQVSLRLFHCLITI